MSLESESEESELELDSSDEATTAGVNVGFRVQRNTLSYIQSPQDPSPKYRCPVGRLE